MQVQVQVQVHYIACVGVVCYVTAACRQGAFLVCQQVPTAFFGSIGRLAACMRMSISVMFCMAVVFLAGANAVAKAEVETSHV